VATIAAGRRRRAGLQSEGGERMRDHPSDRFDFDNFRDDRKPADHEILKRAQELKIHVYRDDDGDLHGEFTISGGFGLFGGDDGTEKEGIQFAEELLAAFKKKPSEGAC
jgi:hypothetical protein